MIEGINIIYYGYFQAKENKGDEKMGDDRKEIRDEIVLLLGKWIRGIRDNIIAEKGAVEQYGDQLQSFNSDFKFNMGRTRLIEALTHIGLDEESVEIISQQLWDFSINIENHKSLAKIRAEEQEHLQEFTEMEEAVNHIIGKLRQLRYNK